MKGLIGCLLLVGLVCVYWKWVLLGLLIFAIVRAVPVAWREYQTERAQRAERAAALVARADQQHRWASEGDPRGTYGEWTPAA